MSDDKDEGWLGGIEAQREAKEAQQVGPSQEVYEVMKGNLREIQDPTRNIGMGGEIREEPEIVVPPKDEIIELSDEIKEMVPGEKALLVILESIILAGADVGWNNHSRHIKDWFAETSVKRGALAIAIRALDLPKEKSCDLYTFLRQNGKASKKKEKVVKEDILKLIFPHCFK